MQSFNFAFLLPMLITLIVPVVGFVLVLRHRQAPWRSYALIGWGLQITAWLVSVALQVMVMQRQIRPSGYGSLSLITALLSVAGGAFLVAAVVSGRRNGMTSGVAPQGYPPVGYPGGGQPQGMQQPWGGQPGEQQRP